MGQTEVRQGSDLSRTEVGQESDLGRTGGRGEAMSSSKRRGVAGRKVRRGSVAKLVAAAGSCGRGRGGERAVEKEEKKC